jgi:hypothetical protein
VGKRTVEELVEDITRGLSACKALNRLYHPSLSDEERLNSYEKYVDCKVSELAKRAKAAEFKS